MDTIYDEFLEKLRGCKNKERATLVYLYGDLGSGKTTFTKNLCKHLGLDIDITSPTFTILKKYPFNMYDFENLIHIDTYRLKSYEELLKIRFDDYLQDKNNLIFLEWPEIVENEGVKPDIILRFKYTDDTESRSIVID
jgi:tRNA threonylcarbamoyladenosine biosynthesis protein TsaE